MMFYSVLAALIPYPLSLPYVPTFGVAQSAVLTLMAKIAIVALHIVFRDQNGFCSLIDHIRVFCPFIYT